MSIEVNSQSVVSSCSVLQKLSCNSLIPGSCSLVQLLAALRQGQAVCTRPSTFPIVCLAHDKLCTGIDSVVSHSRWMGGPNHVGDPESGVRSEIHSAEHASASVSHVRLLGPNPTGVEMRRRYLQASVKLHPRWATGLCLDCRRSLVTAAATIAGLLPKPCHVAQD